MIKTIKFLWIKITKSISLGTYILLLIGCVTPFNGVPSDFEEVLVVESIITQEYKKHEVFLSRSYPFGGSFTPEKNAVVQVNDDRGNTYTFEEKSTKNKFKIKNPKIILLGLNPHAGEGGKIGSEEKDILIPAVKELRRRKINISYPKSADTAFTKKMLNETDAYLGMYHDQVLPVIKALSFGSTTNITLGVPIIRTSVDHGVALDIAGTAKSDTSSLKEAIKIAKKII